MTKDNCGFSIVLDLRCLQDPNYARRGIGRHALAVLRHAPHATRLVGLVDDTLPALPPEAREAVATVQGNAYAARWADDESCKIACFIMLSPMTHDPIFVARLLSDPALLRAAVVHDFIPYRQPDRYLPGPAQQLSYAMALRWLARCDLFLPNSRSTADELAALLGVKEEAIAVTGCPIDPGFEAAALRGQERRYLLVIGGGDARKNPEVVIRAHAGSRALQGGAGIPLVIAGNYSEAEARALRAIAAAAGGRADLIEVPGHLPDAELFKLYGQALAIVCPSQDEGFSIPVIEGMAVGLPCLVSDIPAHAELVADPDCRFPATDDAALRPKLERAVADAGWRAAALARQVDVWPRFRAGAVAERFWGAVLRRLEQNAPAVLRGHRPRVALLSPLPPDRSGVADYTAATCTDFGRLVDLHVFSETKQPAPLRHVASVRPIDALPYVSTGFDRVISVVGNSSFHVRIFNMLRRYGGACIAHDARLLDFYRWQIGKERTLAVASKELHRTVTEAELNAWLEDEGKLEAMFLGEVADSATPTIVHSLVTARTFRDRYATDPVYLPFSIYRPWTAAELTPAHREAARERLGIPRGEVAIATFGFVHSTKAPDDCVWALEVLRGWGIPATLHFVGDLITHQAAAELRGLIAALGLTEQVRFLTEQVRFPGGYISEQIYRDYLVGADLGVQLRTYGLGSVSGALLDCAAAGLPTVVNASLGESVDVPTAYVRRIPDAISPFLLAEALANLLDAGLAAVRPEAERRAFSEARSIANYARNLCGALGLDLPAATRVASGAA